MTELPLANDWFRFYAIAGSSIWVDLSFAPGEGEVVFSLVAPDGSTLGTSTGEAIWVMVAPQTGTYFVYVRLDSDAGAVGVPYVLSDMIVLI